MFERINKEKIGFWNLIKCSFDIIAKIPGQIMAIILAMLIPQLYYWYKTQPFIVKHGLLAKPFRTNDLNVFKDFLNDFLSYISIPELVLVLLVSTVVWLIGTIAIINYSSTIAQNQSVKDFYDLLKDSYKKIFDLILVTILEVLIYITAMIAWLSCFIALNHIAPKGFWVMAIVIVYVLFIVFLMVSFSFPWHAVILKNKNPLQAIAYSFKLSSGFRLHIVVKFLLLGILNFPFLIVIQLASMFLGQSVLGYITFFALNQIIGFVFFIFLTLLFVNIDLLKDQKNN